MRDYPHLHAMLGMVEVDPVAPRRLKADPVWPANVAELEAVAAKLSPDQKERVAIAASEWEFDLFGAGASTAQINAMDQFFSDVFDGPLRDDFFEP